MIISVLDGCSKNPLPEENYIGKTRKEIAYLCAGYERPQTGKRANQILISNGTSSWYFDKVEDIFKHEYLMKAKKWEINFKEGKKDIYSARYYYEVTFDKNDKVIAQKQGCIRDGF